MLCACSPLGAWHRRHRRDVDRALCPAALPRRLVHAQRRRHPLLSLTAPVTAAGLVADLRGMHELAGELAPLDQPAARAQRVDLVEEIEHRRQQQRLRHARRHCDRRRVAAEKEEEVISADAGVARTSNECPVALEPLELLALHRQQQLRREDLLLVVQVLLVKSLMIRLLPVLLRMHIT